MADYNTQLYNAKGKPIGEAPADPQELQGLIQSGQVGFAQGARVNWKKPDGTMISAPADAQNVMEALKSGYQLETGAVREERVIQAEYGGAGHQVLTGVRGALRGASFGLSEQVLAGIFGDDYVEMANKEDIANSGTAVASEIGTVLAAFALPGGQAGAAAKLGKLGKGAYKSGGAIRKVAKLGRDVEKATLKALGGPKGGIVRRALARGTAMGTGAGVEGAIYGGAHYMSETALGNTEMTAENLLEDMGMGAMWGGALGGGMGVAGDIIRRGYGGTKGYIKKLAKSHTQLWEKTSKNKAVSGLSRMVEDGITGTKWGRKFFLGGPQTAKEAVVKRKKIIRKLSKEMVNIDNDIAIMEADAFSVSPTLRPTVRGIGGVKFGGQSGKLDKIVRPKDLLLQIDDVSFGIDAAVARGDLPLPVPIPADELSTLAPSLRGVSEISDVTGSLLTPPPSVLRKQAVQAAKDLQAKQPFSLLSDVTGTSMGPSTSVLKQQAVQGAKQLQAGQARLEYMTGRITPQQIVKRARDEVDAILMAGGKDAGAKAYKVAHQLKKELKEMGVANTVTDGFDRFLNEQAVANIPEVPRIFGKFKRMKDIKNVKNELGAVQDISSLLENSTDELYQLESRIRKLHGGAGTADKVIDIGIKIEELIKNNSANQLWKLAINSVNDMAHSGIADDLAVLSTAIELQAFGRKQLQVIAKRGGEDMGESLYWLADMMDYNSKMVTNLSEGRIKLANVFTEHLENTAFYGAVGTARKEFNAVQGKAMGRNKLVKGLKEELGIAWEPKAEGGLGTRVATKAEDIMESAVTKVVNTLGLGKNKNIEAIFIGQLDDKLAYMKSLRETFDLPIKAVNRIKNAEKSINKARVNFLKIEGKAALENQAGDLTMRLIGLRQFLPMVAGAGVGYAIADGPGMSIGLMLGTGKGAIPNLLSLLGVMGQRSAQKTARRLGNYTNRIVSKPAKLARGMIAPIQVKVRSDKKDKRSMRPDSMNVLQKENWGEKRTKDKSRQEAFDRRTKELIDFLTNPEIAVERLTKNLGDVGIAAPKVAAAMKVKAILAARYLYDKAPKPIDAASLLSGKWKPSDLELARYERIASVVMDPFSVLKSLDAGTLTLGEVDTLKNVWPKKYEEIVMTLLDELPTLREDLPYKERRQLTILFGVPVERTMEPEFMSTIKRISSVQTQQPEPKKSKSKVSDYSKMELDRGYLTSSQRVEVNKLT